MLEHSGNMIGTPSGGESRAHVRKLCSVLSEVFVPLGDSLRYVGPAVVLDISKAGLAIAMDNPPAEDELVIMNRYFEVRAEVRNRTAARDSTRIGLRFTSEIKWHQVLDDESTASDQGARNVARLTWYDRYELCRKFIDVLAKARKKQPLIVWAGIRASESAPPVASAEKEPPGVPTGKITRAALSLTITVTLAGDCISMSRSAWLDLVRQLRAYGVEIQSIEVEENGMPQS